MDKQKCGVSGNRVFFSHKRKGELTYVYNIDEVKVARQKKAKHCMIPFMWNAQTGKFIELESRFMVAWGQEWVDGVRSLC